MPNLPDQAALIEVELLKKHTHDGATLNPGDKIKVDAPTAEWLARNGTAAKAKPAPVLPPEQTNKSFTN